MPATPEFEGEWERLQSEYEERVKPVVAPELDHGPMDVKPQIVEIAMRDGRVVSERVAYPKGNPKNPVTSEELVAAFRGMARYAARPLRDERIEEAIALALNLEDARDVGLLAQLLTSGAASPDRSK